MELRPAKFPNLRIDVDVFQEQADTGRAVAGLVDCGIVVVALHKELVIRIFDVVVFDVLVRGGATREKERRHDGEMAIAFRDMQPMVAARSMDRDHEHRVDSRPVLDQHPRRRVIPKK